MEDEPTAGQAGEQTGKDRWAWLLDWEDDELQEEFDRRGGR